tara:strand:+ start:129 stop:2984 length:2856 start_codon:yes stop_codon:yes gene_type:complete
MPVTNVGKISGPLLKANLTRNSDLTFDNTAVTSTPTLFIGHTNNKIGIRTDSPTRELLVNGDTRVTGDVIATNSASFGNLTFDGPTNTLSASVGSISLNSGSSFTFNELRTDNLSFTNSTIRGYAGDNINIHPGPGTGIFNIPSDLKAYGNIHATGDISFDGNIFIGGDGAEDSLSFEGDITSDIMPDATSTYNLGETGKRWGQMHLQSMPGLQDVIIDNTISLAGVAVNLGIQNKWYVSTNGADNLAGNHPNFAFGTIKHALSYIQESSAGPHELHILPGTYIEEFPLEVPANVTVKGSGIRSVTIKPTQAGRFNDAFLMNDASMVSDLSLVGYQYSSTHDRGYGFRFATNAGIVTKSPYVQNVTVITHGSNRPADDPRGFASGDAGKGALIDGSVLDTASPRASMLFNAVTFITPGVDGITMKNNSRAEIIDCFSYFADTGIKLESGSEARIIASASVYGNKGITADGAGTICYAISHNFAYVGTGKDVENDDSLINQENETEETNGGKVYFVSQDASGDFRVGDNFVIDFSRGTTSININDSDLGGSTLTVGTPGATTVIDATKIDVPNFRISANAISTLENGLTINASGKTVIDGNATMMQNLNVTGNATISGSGINIGDQPGDTVDFAQEFQNDLIPVQDRKHNLGSASKNWKQANLNKAIFDGIEITNNVIRATDSNSSVDLRANGTGSVNLENLSFNTQIQSAGDVGFGVGTNSLQFTGLSNIEVPAGTTAQDPAQGNAIRYDTDRQNFEAFSTGKIPFGGIRDGDYDTYIDLSNNQFDFIAGGTSVGTIDGSGNFVANRLSSQDQFAIDSNTITTGTANNPEASLQANGNGKIFMDTSNFEVFSSTFLNTVTNSDFVLTGTAPKANRYIHFDTNQAYRGHYGTETDRDARANPRDGELFWNQTSATLEVYTASGWKSATGLQEITVTEEFAQDLNVLYNLILN